MNDFLTWPIIGSGLGLVLLVIMFVAVVTVRRAEMRTVLRLPKNAKLGAHEKRILQAFKDTNVRLGKSMPGLSNLQRRAMAREVLRKRGLLPEERIIRGR